MSFFYKLLEKFAQMLVPTGAILPFIGTEVPEGFILWQEYKIYESQLPKLYARYSTVENFTKGSDSSGNYVQLPSINDRTLQACSSFSLVGKLLEAALPNITGSLAHFVYQRGFVDSGFTIAGGVFSWPHPEIGGSASQPSSGSSESVGDYDGIKFDPSSVNARYSGSTVQPSAAQTLMIIKV